MKDTIILAFQVTVMVVAGVALALHIVSIDQALAASRWAK